VLRIRISFLTSESGIGKKSISLSVIYIPYHIFDFPRAKKHFFCVKMLKFLDADRTRDPESLWPWIRDPGWKYSDPGFTSRSGINIRIPEYWCENQTLFQNEVGEIVLKSRDASIEGKRILDFFQISTSNAMPILLQVIIILVPALPPHFGGGGGYYLLVWKVWRFELWTDPSLFS